MLSLKYLTLVWFSVTGFVITFWATSDFSPFSSWLPSDLLGFSFSSVKFFVIIAGVTSGLLVGLLIYKKNKHLLSVSSIKLIFLSFYYTLLGYIITCILILVFAVAGIHDILVGGVPGLYLLFLNMLLSGGWTAFIIGPLSFILFIMRVANK
jgi:hypothetical protein